MPLISKQVVRKIENELYSYPVKIKELAARREEILHGSHYPDVPASGGEMGNTTQSKGMRLAQIETDWVRLISEALTTIPLEYQLLIKYRFFEGRTNDMAAEALHVSRALYFAWKETSILCICLLATQRGLIHPMESLRKG